MTTPNPVDVPDVPTPVVVPDVPTPVDYMSAAAEILAAIAWPVAIVSLVLIFRKPILKALQGLVEFKWGSASFRFDRKLDQLVESVAESVDTPPRVSSGEPTLSEAYGDDDPRAAIVRGYLAIEDWAATNLPTHGIGAERNGRVRPLMDMIREAVSKGKLPPPTIAHVQGLQTLRNLAVHSPTDPTPEQAAEFLMVADNVLDAMRSAFE